MAFGGALVRGQTQESDVIQTKQSDLVPVCVCWGAPTPHASTLGKEGEWAGATRTGGQSTAEHSSATGETTILHWLLGDAP